MANLNVTKTNKVVQIMKESIDKVILELSKEEAIALMILTGGIGGCKTNTLRQLSDPIYYALSKALFNGIDSVSSGCLFKCNSLVKDNTLDIIQTEANKI